MATGKWIRSAAVAGFVGLAAVTLFGLAAATAPAGNRDPVPELYEFPGPEQVTFGENVAYTATLSNAQSSNFTHVAYRHKVPTTTLAGLPANAELVYASCDPDRESWMPDADGFYTCPEMAQLRAGDTARILLVFRTPGNSDGVGDNVSCNASNSCVLTSSGYWLMKEGTGKPGSSGPDTFPPLDGPPLTITTDLLGAALDLTRARGYVLDECSSGSSLETSTSLTVGPNNKLATEVCATSIPGKNYFPSNPGLLIHLDELPITAPLPAGLTKRITEVSFICMPEPEPDLDPGDPFGQCPTTPGYFDVGYDPWSFDDPGTPGVEQGTFTFTIDNTTLPKGEKIDAVYHNGVLVSSCSASPGADPCVVSIVVDKRLKITIVTVRSAEQGGWDFT